MDDILKVGESGWDENANIAFAVVYHDYGAKHSLPTQPNPNMDIYSWWDINKNIQEWATATRGPPRLIVAFTRTHVYLLRRNDDGPPWDKVGVLDIPKIIRFLPLHPDARENQADEFGLADHALKQFEKSDQFDFTTPKSIEYAPP